MPAKPRVRLVTSHRDAAPDRARAIEKAGFEVDASPFPTAQAIGRVRAFAPAVIVIDLDRLPSHGRIVAAVLRSTKSTSLFPIVFAGGAPEKVERARKDFPDLVFTTWKEIGKDVKKLARNPPPPPRKTIPYMQQWAGTSLAKKLGFQANLTAALLNAPEAFEEVLGELPAGAELRSSLTRQTRLALWFIRSRSELDGEIAFLTARLPEGCHIWIIYPKKTSRYRTDFNQYDVRAAALAVGWVDYKVCAVDADWTGLKFARRRAS